MTKLIIAAGILVLFVIAISVIKYFLLDGKSSSKPKFQYGRQKYIMTPAERECYDALIAEMGFDYFFFPQIHLDAIVYPNSTGRDRLYAFRHINQKSVDFVACSKRDMQPLFAVELDDKTHSQSQRVERDKEVERILQGAGIPLIRVENRGRIEPKALAQFIQKGIDSFAKRPL